MRGIGYSAVDNTNLTTEYRTDINPTITVTNKQNEVKLPLSFLFLGQLIGSTKVSPFFVLSYYIYV